MHATTYRQSRFRTNGIPDLSMLSEGAPDRVLHRARVQERPAEKWLSGCLTKRLHTCTTIVICTKRRLKGRLITTRPFACICDDIKKVARRSRRCHNACPCCADWKTRVFEFNNSRKLARANAFETLARGHIVRRIVTVFAE